jgi:hypothetical protein
MLINEMLEPMVQKKNPQTLIIGMYPALYLDPDVSSKEAQTLFTYDLKKIKELTRRYHLITVLTNRDMMPLPTSHGFGATLYTAVDEIVRMKQFEQYTSLELIKQQKKATMLHCTQGQLRLEEFGMVS